MRRPSASECERSLRARNGGGNMHRLQIRTYAGAPGETASLTTQVDGSGQVVVREDGVDIGARRTLQLKANPGDQTSLRISLFGATGETCLVGVSTVDGGTDGDLLVCQPHDPAPVHFYTFIVVAPATLKSFAAMGQQKPAKPKGAK
jgi:hypothetical protein